MPPEGAPLGQCVYGTANFVSFKSLEREIGEKSRGVIAVILLSTEVEFIDLTITLNDGRFLATLYENPWPSICTYLHTFATLQAALVGWLQECF